jgi:hypothetical protein
LLSIATVNRWTDALHHRLSVPLAPLQAALATALGFADAADLAAQVQDEAIRSPQGRPFDRQLPPLATAKTWAKRLSKALTAAGHSVTLAQSQAAWAHAFGVSTWNGVATRLTAAEAARAHPAQNPWGTVDASTLTHALMQELMARDPATRVNLQIAMVFLAGWVKAVLRLRDQGYLDVSAGVSALTARLTPKRVWQDYRHPALTSAEHEGLELAFRVTGTAAHPVPVAAQAAYVALLDEVASALNRLKPARTWLGRQPGQPLTDDERTALREALFAPHAQAEGAPQHPLRFLAVVPDPADRHAAIVHYAYNPPHWERAGDGTDPETFLRQRLARSVFHADSIPVVGEPYQHWPIAWGQTAKDDTNNMPTLVGVERADGSVTGCLLRNSFVGAAARQIAAHCAEEDEALAFVTQLQGEPVHTLHWGLYTERALSGASLVAVLAQMPTTAQGQKMVVLYRDGEWFHGFWNDPSRADNAYRAGRALTLGSVSDVYGGRVSAAKVAQRQDLAAIRSSFAYRGDHTPLHAALAAHTATAPVTDEEAYPPVRGLCEAWNAIWANTRGPAALFSLYVWNPVDRIFVPGDPDEPALLVADLVENPMLSWALFEAPGKPSVAVCFYRGRAFHTPLDGQCTQTYYADGTPAFEVGLPMAAMDEAATAVRGLDFLRRRLEAG